MCMMFSLMNVMMDSREEFCEAVLKYKAHRKQWCVLLVV